MRLFKTKPFARFARKGDLSDETLAATVEAMLAGAVDADLGGGVFKQRVARSGEGKSGGYRIVVLMRRGDRAIFAHGFAKNAKANLDDKELRAFKQLAEIYFSFSDAQLVAAVAKGALIELTKDGKEEQEHDQDPQAEKG